jgi:hypothetical protein
VSFRIPGDIIRLFSEYSTCTKNSSHGYWFYNSQESLVLSHVCQHWRRSLIENQLLWTHIHLDRVKFASLCLSRCPTAGVDVVFGSRCCKGHNPTSTSNARDVPKFLAINLHRVVNIDVKLPIVHINDLHITISSTAAPLLESFNYRLIHPRPNCNRLVLLNNVLRLSLPIFSGQTPRLRTMCWHYPGSLDGQQKDIEPILSLARSSPAITRIDTLIYNWVSFEETSALQVDFSIVQLKNLSSLSLCVQSARQLKYFDRVELPVLMKLFLSIQDKCLLELNFHSIFEQLSGLQSFIRTLQQCRISVAGSYLSIQGWVSARTTKHEDEGDLDLIFLVEDENQFIDNMAAFMPELLVLEFPHSIASAFLGPLANVFCLCVEDFTEVDPVEELNDLNEFLLDHSFPSLTKIQIRGLQSGFKSLNSETLATITTVLAPSAQHRIALHEQEGCLYFENEDSDTIPSPLGQRATYVFFPLLFFSRLASYR